MLPKFSFFHFCSIKKYFPLPIFLIFFPLFSITRKHLDTPVWQKVDINSYMLLNLVTLMIDRHFNPLTSEDIHRINLTL